MTDDEITNIACKHCKFIPEGTYLYKQFESQYSLVEFVRECIALAASRTPTAGNTEDARSMGAVSEDTRLLDWWERNPDMVRHGLGYLGASASWCALIDDAWMTFQTLRAALTRAASMGGAAS